MARTTKAELSLRVTEEAAKHDATYLLPGIYPGSSLPEIADGLYGRGDAATEKAVNHYRKRVLKGAIGEAAAVEAPDLADTPEPAPPAAPEPPAASVTTAPGIPEPVVEERPEEAPAPPGKPATKASAKAAPKTPAKAPVPSPTGAVCESCGVPVSAAEEKTSRLFVSKVLCKKCIQSL